MKRKQADILVLREKHGNKFYDISTDEKLEKAALKILRERRKEKWYAPLSAYGYPSETSILQVQDMLHTARQGIGSRTDSTVEQLEDIIKEMKQERVQYKEHEDFLDKLKLALDTKDGNLAWSLLIQRRDFEYEDFDTVYFSKV